MSKKKAKNKKDSSTNIKEIIEDIENTKELKKNEKCLEQENSSAEIVENNIFKKEKKVNDKLKKNNNNNIFTNFILFIILVTSLVYFFCSLITRSISNLTEIISLLTIILFTISFVVVGIRLKTRKKGLFLVGALCLGVFYLVNINNTLNIFNIDSSVELEDFREKTLTEVMEWSSNNKIEINQEYEYSDMIEEYKIISQNYPPGTKLKSISNLTLAISEGPNPYKDIIVPNMISWDTERVIDFVNKNYLSNVNVEFKESGEPQDTVIEQDKIGNIKRNEEINLVFSIGEKINYDDKFRLTDFTNKSKFEAVLYLKQHYLGFEIVEDYSNNIKKGYIMKQSIDAGNMVKVNDWIKLTISKGPEIKVPDLTKMTTTELTKWIIENKLKVKFSDKYDSNIKKNRIISVNYKAGDKVSQGTVIEVILSKGQLKMNSFKSLDEFKNWADKYGIKYEEQHEFSSTVKAGDVISYSIKKGDVIKNEDVVIIKISDGEKIKVPDLEGLTKKEIESKLDKLGLSYYFIYKSSSTVSEGKAFKQSISAGSEVSNGTTITITISSGKASSNSSNSNNSSSNGNNSSGGSSGGDSSSIVTPPSNTCDTSKGDYFNIQPGNTGSQTKTIISGMNPNHKIQYSFVKSCPNGDSTSGAVCSTSGFSDGDWISYCTTITIVIVE